MTIALHVQMDGDGWWLGSLLIAVVAAVLWQIYRDQDNLRCRLSNAEVSIERWAGELRRTDDSADRVIARVEALEKKP